MMGAGAAGAVTRSAGKGKETGKERSQEPGLPGRPSRRTTAGPRVRPALGQVTMTARNPACRPALHAARRPRPPRSAHRGTTARVGLRGGGSPRAHASRGLRTAEGSSADPPQPRVPGCAAPEAGGGCAGTRARRASGPALQRRRPPPAPAPRRAVHPPTGPPPPPSPRRRDLPPGQTTLAPAPPPVPASSPSPQTCRLTSPTSDRPTHISALLRCQEGHHDRPHAPASHLHPPLEARLPRLPICLGGYGEHRPPQSGCHLWVTGPALHFAPILPG
ncbi:unnamed protein product [Rangifer tarandus platyrhynchus]|uniref:Uncharacterized protein n=2 Tax=Rangifer tarandus platyrhynchus TaxID=3082113 RepID=A0ACB0F6J5_RANTA|nr:unnamed protein product [Rangifer tarandus platyrhynchus]CAI9708650.1 unnamed protein product [Rangifer tarandus platyrhynchus]